MIQYPGPPLIAHVRRIKTQDLENENPDKDTQENDGEGRQTILQGALE